MKGSSAAYMLGRDCEISLKGKPVFSTRDFKAVPAMFWDIVPEYITDYVSLNQFAA